MEKASNGSFSIRPTLSPTTFAQVIVLPEKLFQSFPPIRSPEPVELTSRLNYPSPLRFEEFHPNRIAVAMDWLAVSHPSRRTKFASARSKHNLRTFIPATHAHHSCPARAYVFRKRRLSARVLPMPV